MNYRRMVPNSISGLSMVLGVLSIYLSMDGEFSRAAIFIILAVLADSCDGRAARLLGVSGEFGKEMDSICDVCSFGMAPAVLIYTYGLTDLGLWGQIISSLFTFGAGLRLARFNVNTSVVSGYFEGMPAPAGACVLVTYVLSGYQFGPMGTAILTLLVAKLMYSEVRYPDFKGHGNPLFKVPVILSFAIGGSYCGEADRGSSNHDDTGTVADAGRYDEYYKCGGITDRGSDGNLDTGCIIGVPGRYFTFCF